EKMEVPTTFAHYGGKMAGQGVLRMQQVKAETNLAEVLAEDVFPVLPLLKTANMVVILGGKSDRGEGVSAGEVRGVLISFGDDVLTVGPGVYALATKGARMLRTRALLKGLAEGSGAKVVGPGRVFLQSELGTTFRPLSDPAERLWVDGLKADIT